MNSVHIELTKSQYRQLLHAVGIAGFVFDRLSDAYEKSEYDGHRRRMETLEDEILKHANSIGIYDWTEVYKDKNVFSDKAAVEDIIPVIQGFNDVSLSDELANALAWRDFRRTYSEEEIEKMSEEHHGYFGVPLYEYEERYWKEFDEHGYDRLEVVDTDKKSEK